MPSLETLCFPISLWLVKISGNEGAGRGEVIRSFRKSTKPYRLADGPVSRPGPFFGPGRCHVFFGWKITEKKAGSFFVLNMGFLLVGLGWVVFENLGPVISWVLKFKPVVPLQFFNLLRAFTSLSVVFPAGGLISITLLIEEVSTKHMKQSCRNRGK